MLLLLLLLLKVLLKLLLVTISVLRSSDPIFLAGLVFTFVRYVIEFA